MLTSEKLNQMWRDALNLGDPTAGNAHIRFARAIEAKTLKAHQRDMEAAVLAEREACALLVDEICRCCHSQETCDAAESVAEEIRARTQTMRTNDAHKEDA